jgi:hypothetical protein
VPQSVALPLLDLTPVLQQLVGAQPGDQATEAATGIDRRELPGVADQDDLCSARFGNVEKPAQLAAAGHAGFVQDHQRAGLQADLRSSSSSLSTV